MASTHLYCTACGAANQTQDTYCFSCGRLLRGTTPLMQYPTVVSASNTLTGLLTLNHLLKQRYRILEQLGKGGFGAVYKAEDTQFGDRLVAVKEMGQRELKTQQEITEATDAFKREVLMLAGLRHQNLPRIYDHFSDGGRWYLVMDYIEGETLGDHLDKVGGHLPVEEALQIGIQLCTVLDYLHTRQPPIIFRDLTPNNIMLTPDGHLYLIDFGIARLFKPGQSKDTTAFGTLGYAAPELLSRQTTPQSDIYSLGALLHHMLTGTNPTQTPFRFAPPQLSGNPALMRLSTLVMQMLDMDESRRPASMTAVKQELQQIAAQLAGKTPLPPTQLAGGTLPSLIQRSQGKKRTVGIIAGIFVLVVMVAVLIPPLLNNHLQSSPQAALSNPSNAPAPTATPTSAPTPTATPPPRSGAVLYQAEWSQGLNGWVGAPDWKAAFGMLVDDGSGPHYWRMSITAPFTPTTSNYAIEAEIQVVTVGGCSSFGLVGRATNGQGEQMGVNFCECHCVGLWDRDDVPHYNYDPGTDWHTYRFELKGTSMNFFIDNTKIITAVDNRFTTPGSVGLWCDQMAINVRTYTVYAL